MPNLLIHENSLYLYSHAYQPVDWLPWGQKAFEQAKALNKPILLSIGYAACHWCHVMAQECFEDDYIASIMNRHFVCIKVDRQQYPAVDQTYIQAIQMLTQKAGWPLHAFCLPDGRPFFGGTYFPPEDSGLGIVPFPQLLIRISNFYKNNFHELLENAHNITQNILYSNNPQPINENIHKDILSEAIQTILQSYDADFGGFGKNEKFPPSMILLFLLKIKKEHPENTQNLDKAITHTLLAMTKGAIYDHLSGGFFRYTVDREWKVPHFEKMLYDNALAIQAYTKAYTLFPYDIFKKIVYQTIDWLINTMRDDQGLFYYSVAASTQGQEGAYYTFTKKEIEEVLDPIEAKTFCEQFSITQIGNFKDGRSILFLKENENSKDLTSTLAILLQTRNKRQKPIIDTTYSCTSNSLLASALATASVAFNNIEWLSLSENILDCIYSYYQKNLELFTVAYQDGSTLGQTASDYTYYAQACLVFADSVIDLQKKQTYIQRAQNIIKIALGKFQDPDNPGIFNTKNDDCLFVRHKEWLDNAWPAANSSLLFCLKNLYQHTKEPSYWDAYIQLKTAYTPWVQKAPNAVAHALSSFF